MTTIVIAKNNKTGEQREFSTADWYNYNQTGDWTKQSTKVVPDLIESQSRGISTNNSKEPIKAKKKGCGCGRKK